MAGINRVVSLVIAVTLAFVAFSAFNGYKQKHAEVSDILNNIRIAIDPGHGGVDGGASLGEHFNEKDINLDISLKLKELLENFGAEVILTRDSDVSLESKSDLQASRYRRDLDARRDIVNNSNANVSISIHSNCFRSNPQTKGAIVFYYHGSEEGKRLAQFIGKSINEIVYKRFLGNDVIKCKILPEDLFMLRSIKIPGVLVEVGYMTNQEEGRLLKQEEFQAAMAIAISDGLKNYIKHNNDVDFVSKSKVPLIKLLRSFVSN